MASLVLVSKNMGFRSRIIVVELIKPARILTEVARKNEPRLSDALATHNQGRPGIVAI
jgi:hypothetical protein